MPEPSTPQATTSDIVGYKPNAGRWTVRRCVIHELVPHDDEFCPVICGPDEACGMRLSEPFDVRAADA